MPQNYPRRVDDKRINNATKTRMITLKRKVLNKVSKEPK